MDDLDFESEDYSQGKTPKNYPRCYADSKHDGDPICRPCAKEEYGKIPKLKLKGPRNCWRCEEMGVSTEETYKEPYYE